MSAAAQSNAIEDIYELSPLQQGMLFHCLYNPKTWMYFEQVVVPVRNRVNADCLIRAWKRVLERHPALRTSFHWEGLDKPLQVVHREVEFSIERHDWSGVDAGERERRLEDFLKADRDRGFVLSGAPLIRLALVQFSEEDFRYILSFHHLLMDGWSLQVVNREVSVLYEAYCLGREMQLEASRPYGDYIAWLQGQNAEAGKTFWREMLSGFEGPAPLGAERSPGAERTEEVYSEQEMRLPREATAALQSLAQRTHVTLNTVMLGAWALLLSRYSGEEEVVFGSVVSGRPPELRGVESMVGLFINTLPVRTQIHDETPLSGWLQRLQEHHLEARRYEFTSLTDIHTWSGRPAGMPLFQSVLAFENYPTGAMSTPQAENFEGFRQFERTNYPLSAVVVPGAELLVRILYDLHRFEDSTITRLLGHLETILVSMGGDAEQRLGDVSVLPPAEVRQLMVEWNNTKVEQAGTQCVHRLFEAQVERTPDAPALAFGGQRVTYRSLNAQANQLARSLQTLGLRAGSLAGISMERSPQWIAAVLAVWKAGAAYVPLDPALPPERLSFMVKDAGLDVLLTQEELRAALPPDVSNLEDMATPRDAAYVIYTSGSTGRPKGVVVEHRGLSNTAEATVRTLGLGPGDRVLQFAPWSFDASVYELMMTLLSGAELFLADPDSLLPGEGLLRLLQQEKITTISLPPSALAAMPVREMPYLKLIGVLGEACPADLAAAWAPGRRIFNAYGPTETTVWVAGAFIDGSRKPPIGRPIANTRIYLLDSRLRPVPIGVPGEICVGGMGVARGYLNTPELTAARFLPDAFSGEAGARLYRTGDLARYLQNGELEFLGRRDQQVKLRGFRIEPGEIETVLAQHATVRQAAVTVREDTPGDRRLVAYIVCDALEPPPAELRRFLRSRLPEYMVPSAFVFLESLPLLSNGKANLRALPAPVRKPELKTYVAPRTSVESKLATLWAEVLRVERAGVHDNFFDSGGHSLLATQLLSRVREAFEVELPLRSLFDAQDLASLAELITSLAKAPSGAEAAGGEYEQGEL